MLGLPPSILEKNSFMVTLMVPSWNLKVARSDQKQKVLSNGTVLESKADENLGIYAKDFPFTNKGFTYDWCRDSIDNVGVEEYIVEEGCEVEIVKVETLEEYVESIQARHRKKKTCSMLLCGC